MDINTVFNKFFEVRDQTHYLHLQTKSYSEHKTLQSFYEGWIELADSFIETFQGQFPGISGKVTIELVSYSEGTSLKYLKSVLLFLQSDARKVIFNSNTDLNAILDEMQILTSQTIYLLSLK
jgi:hypothetical protein